MLYPAQSMSGAVLNTTILIGNIIIIYGILRNKLLRNSGIYICMLVLCLVDIIDVLALPVHVDAVTPENSRHDFPLSRLSIMHKLFGAHAETLMLLLMAACHMKYLANIQTGERTKTSHAITGSLGMLAVAFILALGLSSVIILDDSKTFPGESACCATGTCAGNPRNMQLLIMGTVIYILLLAVIVTMIVLGAFTCHTWNILQGSDGDGKLAAMLIVQMSVFIGSRMLCVTLESVHALTGIKDNADYGLPQIMAFLLYVPVIARPVFYLCFCPLLRRSMTVIIVIAALVIVIPDAILLDDSRMFLGRYFMCLIDCPGSEDVCIVDCQRKCFRYLDMRIWRLRMPR